MDGSRFDAWTRRGIGLALGGGVISALGLSLRDDATAKKKKKKKRCKKLKQACQPGSKTKCCQDLACGESVALPLGTHCLRRAQGACADASECLAPSLCDDGHCCFLEEDGPCSEDEDCCDTLLCNTSTNVCAQPA
jgi:hypothetical protein